MEEEQDKATPSTSQPTDADDPVFLEDEQWTLASYMEGMSEHQDVLDAKVRESLRDAFNTMHEGLDSIEEGHKTALRGIEKQREGLIKFRKVIDNTPLYNVGNLLEDIMGESVTEEGGDKDEAKESMSKVDIPEPTMQPIRIQAPGKGGKGMKRHYKCPKSKCKFVRVNREAVNAHIRQKHDKTKIGPCTGCDIYYSHNKESFLVHMAGCAGGCTEQEQKG